PLVIGAGMVVAALGAAWAASASSGEIAFGLTWCGLGLALLLRGIVHRAPVVEVRSDRPTILFYATSRPDVAAAVGRGLRERPALATVPAFGVTGFVLRELAALVAGRASHAAEYWRLAGAHGTPADEAFFLRRRRVLA